MKYITRLILASGTYATQPEHGEPVKLGDLQCVKIRNICTPWLRAEKALERLADQPAEVRSAARDEIVALVRTLPRPASDILLRRVIDRLALPDTPLTYSKEHAELARRIVSESLADCLVCVVTPVEFMLKFVREVYEAQDRRGRLVYRIVVAPPDDNDGEFVITVPHSAFRRGKRIAVPSELNDTLRAKLGIEIEPKLGLDLRTALETHAKPEDVEAFVLLRQALRVIIATVPAMPRESLHGRWCRGGKLYVPYKVIGHIVDKFTLRFRSKHAFLKIARRFGVLDHDHAYRYAPADADCGACGYAYVFDADRFAELLGMAPQEICETP